jgi:hypothetical protein
MIAVQIVMYSLLVAFVSAGFVWYGWGLMRNLRAMRQHRAETQAEAAESDPKEG